MVLNYIWVAFFVIAFIVALCKLIFMGDVEIFTELVNSTFSSSKTAFEISLGLIRNTRPLARRDENRRKQRHDQCPLPLAESGILPPLPRIPKGHPAMGSIFMNLSANMLGWTMPLLRMGLKAMKELQELNAKKESASDPMIMFLCINASGLTLIPVSIMTYRAQMGAANPADVFLPLMLATFSSTLVAILAVCFKQRINILQRNLLLFFGGMITFVGGLALLFGMMSQQSVSLYSTLFANILTFLHHMRIHHQRYSQENQRIRHFYRRSERRFPDRRNDHPLPHRRPGRHCRFPSFRSNGFPDRRHSHGSRGSRTGHAICGRPAYHANEAA